jgi:hypothetical protein
MVAERNLQAAFWAIDGVGLSGSYRSACFEIVPGGKRRCRFRLSGIRNWRRRYACWDCWAPCSKRSVIWRGHSVMVRSASPHELSQGIRHMDSPGRHCWRNSLCDYGARIFWGEHVLPTASPLPFFAYPFLVLTIAGWIWTLLKRMNSIENSVQQSGLIR